MNILDSSLVCYQDLGIKNCKEIQFSNGGQYVACQSGSNIVVYKFYTAESPPEFTFKGHQASVKKIAWFEDDTGFTSCGWDNLIMMFRLFPQKKESSSN